MFILASLSVLALQIWLGLAGFELTGDTGRRSSLSYYVVRYGEPRCGRLLGLDLNVVGLHFRSLP